MKEYPHIEVDSVDELNRRIDEATKIKQLDDLRWAVVKAKDNGVLLKWQDKFWGLKRCPTCGHIRD